MSKLKFLLIWLHNVFEMHDFELEPKLKATGYRARCRCGVYLKATLALVVLLLASVAGAQTYDANGRLLVNGAPYQQFDLAKVGGTTVSGANVVDAGNTAFRVNCVAGCVAGGSFSDSTAFSFGSSAISLTGFVVDDTSTNTVAENSAGAARMNPSRILYVDLSKTAANATAVKVDGTGGSFPVTGTFWQTTQPVSWSGQTVTATQGTGSNLHVVVDTAPSTAVTGTFWPTTAAAPASHRLSDGTGFYDAAKTGQLPSALVGGRLDANLGAWLGSTAPTVGSKTSANSVPVVIASDQAAVPASQSGNWTARVVGNAGGAVDAANNAAAPANVVVVGAEARSSGPTQNTNGNVARVSADLAGNLTVVVPLKFTCALDNIAASLTQCQAVAASGYSYYITAVFAQSTTSTAATFAIRSGTGTNCGTSTTGVLPGATTSRTYVLPANTAAAFAFSNDVGIKVTAGHAICAIGAATNTLNITIAGYTAP